MIRRLPIIPTIFVLGAVAVLAWLGVWQLQRAHWKEALLTRYEAAQKEPPIAFPTVPLADKDLPLFRYATGNCLKIVGKRVVGGENLAEEPGYSQIVECATGAEGPGMSVDVGWSKNPSAEVNWQGGPVSGLIVPDRQTRIRLVAASSPAGLQPSAPPPMSAISPGGHRGYAATWFALAATALIIYGLALRKRLRESAKG